LTQSARACNTARPGAAHRSAIDSQEARHDCIHHHLLVGRCLTCLYRICRITR